MTPALVLGPSAATRQQIGKSATAEAFRLRRISIVDTCWVLFFMAGFVLSGIPAFVPLAGRMIWSPAMSLFSFLTVVCLSGLASGVIGIWFGHLLASMIERWDLWRRPRRYEVPPGMEV
jgi:hypothetical protein